MDIWKLKRAPTHPGQILLNEFLKPLRISQQAFADAAGVHRPWLNDMIHGRHRLRAEAALRLAKVLGTSPEVWMHLQNNFDRANPAWCSWWAWNAL